MTKRISTAHEVPADVGTTFLALSSERWPEAVTVALQDDSRVVTREQTADGGALLIYSRKLPDGVPGFLQRFLPKDGRVTQTDTWGPADTGGADRHGTWVAAFAGAPGEVHGTMTLTPTPAGCTWTVTGQATFTIPLIGGRVESFIVELVEKLVAKQAPVLVELVQAD